MHQRKLHLLALCENDLLEPWLNSTLSLWVRRSSLQWIGAVCAERLSVSCLPHLSPVCLTKACSEAVWSGPLSRFPSSCLLPEPISKIESRCHLLTPCFLTKCVQFTIADPPPFPRGRILGILWSYQSTLCLDYPFGMSLGYRNARSHLCGAEDATQPTSVTLKGTR